MWIHSNVKGNDGYVSHHACVPTVRTDNPGQLRRVIKIQLHAMEVTSQRRVKAKTICDMNKITQSVKYS